MSKRVYPQVESHGDSVTVTAYTTVEAQEAAAKALGTDCTITHVERVQQGGLGGFFATELVRLTARPASTAVASFARASGSTTVRSGSSSMPWPDRGSGSPTGTTALSPSNPPRSEPTWRLACPPSLRCCQVTSRPLGLVCLAHKACVLNWSRV